MHIRSASGSNSIDRMLLNSWFFCLNAGTGVSRDLGGVARSEYSPLGGGDQIGVNLTVLCLTESDLVWWHFETSL